MMTVEIDVIAANLPAFLDKVAAGETILISSDRTPVAELSPPTHAGRAVPDEAELARRRKLVGELDELRVKIKQRSGVQPDSTPMIREMCCNE
jgi:antitoxin (DNA-binding transcriptional repressor) of toxin-antitoxin stability system